MANVAVDKKALVEGERPIFQASYGKLMMWFFLVSDAFTFSALLIAYGALRVSAVSEGLAWAFPEDVFIHTPILHEVFHIDLPLVFVGIMTFILILSSVTMVLGVEAGHRKAQKEVSKWVFLTMIGGATFLACQAYEWYHFISGTPDGAALILAEKMEDDNGPNLDDKVAEFDQFKVVEMTPIYEGDDHDDHDPVALELRNGERITGAQMNQILEVASHTHAGTWRLDHDQALDNNIPSLDKNFAVPVYIVYKTDSTIAGLRMWNGYEVENDGKNVDQLLDMSGERLDEVPRTQGGASLKANQYGPPDFAGLFFFVTGFHGTHVFSGVVLLLILLINVNKGTYDRRGHYEMTEKIGLYWHFVDLVWVFVFTFFYLV
ncbi:MAG: cytochrome c oxidase subunit 3 [Bacteroidota bacterium]